MAASCSSRRACSLAGMHAPRLRPRAGPRLRRGRRPDPRGTKRGCAWTRGRGAGHRCSCMPVAGFAAAGASRGRDRRIQTRIRRWARARAPSGGGARRAWRGGRLGRRLRHRPGRAPGGARGRRRRRVAVLGQPILPGRTNAATGCATSFGAAAGRALSVTPYGPGVPNDPRLFAARNWTLAALADAVVVVEGAVDSGTRHTAVAARALGSRSSPGPRTSSARPLRCRTSCSPRVERGPSQTTPGAPPPWS